MLMLTATTDSIGVTTANGAAYDVDVVSTFIDRVTSTGAIGEAQRELETITGSGDTDIVESPAADTTRKVKYINIRNAHATSAVDILVYFDANATKYELHKATLLAGESLCYIEKIGFFKLSDTTRDERIMMVAAGGFANTSVTPTFVDITGLTCPMKAGVMYGVLAMIHHSSSAATVAPRISYNIGAAPTNSRFSMIDPAGATPLSTSAATIATGTGTARDTAIIAETDSSTSALVAIFAGIIVPSADGTFALRVCNDAAGTVTILTGTWMRVFRPTG